jgi:imidazolonepropionase-like amidohydrolase
MNRNIRIGLLLSCAIALGISFLPATRVWGQAKPAEQTKAVKLGKLWDGHKVWSNPIVIIDGAKIRTVTTDASEIPTRAQVIDLSRYTGLPGLIDVHTHMTMYTDETPGVPMLKQITANPPATEVFLARKGAMRTLENGVTTVRDLGADQYMDIAMRNLINRAEMIGPRMYVVGYGLYITNTPYKPGINPPAGGIADGVPEVLRVVRQQIAAGVDWIKLYASTGTDDDVTGFETFNYDEIKAAVDTAHQFGKRIAIHSYGPDGARDAVRAGTDTLEHATDMDDATIAELVRKKIWYVPTINHNQHYVDRADDAYKFPAQAKQNLRNYIERNFLTAQKAYKAGARMVVGSDAVYTGFGANMQELRWFVKLGMSNEQALQSATVLPAEMLGVEKSLGSVAPGYVADIVAVEGDPLADIEVAIGKVRWVMKAGSVVVDKTGNSLVR